MKKEDFFILSLNNFPENDFFVRLNKGWEHFIAKNYERSLEEWLAALRSNDLPSVIGLEQQNKYFFGGRISSLPLIYFLYAIYAHELTGMAVVKEKNMGCKLFFKQGHLVMANSSKTESRLGNFLLKQKDISLHKLELFVKQARQEQKRLGRFLVEKKIISENTLRDILSLQIQEVVAEMLAWEKGNYFFVEMEIKEADLALHPLEVMAVVAKRQLTFERFKKLVPSNKIIFRLSPYIEQEKVNILDKLNANDRFIFSLIDGKRNIEQIINFSGGEETSVINTLYYFLEQGFVRITKDVVEYEDEEFVRISDILNTLSSIWEIIYKNLFTHIGQKTNELVERSLKKIPAEYQKVIAPALIGFKKIDKELFLKNFVKIFSDAEDRFVFVDIFQESFLAFLEEGERFLGNYMIKKVVEDIEKTRKDIEKFYLETETKELLLKVLDVIVKRFC